MALRITLLTVLCTWTLFTCAQQNARRINSGEIIENGIKLYDDGKYEPALKEFDKVPVGDTNYVYALYKSALSCSADSQFARGIAYCELGLADRSDPGRDPEMLALYGSLLDYNNEQYRALQVFDSALLVYPAYISLYISKGTTLMRMNKYAEAEKVLRQAALISPYAPNVHHKLGLSALNQGKVVPAFLCMMASLAMEPGGRYYKNAIKILSEISTNTSFISGVIGKRTEEPSDNFRLVEQIILSKIALDKNYKILIGLDDDITRQMQVLLEKLAFDVSDPDYYMQYYVPVFKKIFEEKKFEYFVNYIFSAANLAEIKDFNKEKKKEIEALKMDLAKYFDLLRATRELQHAKRNINGPHYHFSEGNLFGKGVLKEKDIFTGPWTFYYTSGNKKAEGLFNDKGGKEGVFSYYYFNGRLNGQETYLDGKQEGPETYYSDRGAVTARATYKNGQPDGQYTIYYDNGVIKTIKQYNNGQLNGVKKTFYINGRLESEETYAGDELHGDFRRWNSEGILIAEGSYREGLFAGTVKRYDDYGKLRSVEPYDNNGLLEGEYIAYHENGKLAYSHMNKNGKASGSAVYYDVNGKFYSTLVYDKGRLVSGRYFDKTGKLIGLSLSKNGKMDLTAFNPDGTKQSFAPYNEYGALAGTKINYFGSGKEKQLEAYSNGVLNGETVAYHPGGNKSYTVQYANGIKTGYYRQWYPHGGMQEEGWYGDDQVQGEWLSYDKYGSLTSSSWYLNGAINGLKTTYWPNGKMQTVNRFEMDKLASMSEYDTTGKVINVVKLNNGSGKFTSRYPNGKLYGESNYVNGDIEGPSRFYYPDGSLMSISHYKHGMLDSNYLAYHYGGMIRAEGRYKMNEKEGTWKYYSKQGELYCTEEYRSGKPGKSMFYFKNGKIDTEIENRNNQRHGLYKRYAEDGSLMYQVRYDNGLEAGYNYLAKNGRLVPEIPLIQGNGQLKAFYQNGKPSATMEFVDGALHGAHTLYHPNGKVWTTDHQYYDNIEGIRKENFSNGKLHSHYTYKHDNLHGPYKEYNAQGKLVEEGNYYNDGLHGEQRLYDDNGKLRQVRIYYYGLLLVVK